MEQPTNYKYHRSNRSSPAMVNGIYQQSTNYSYHHNHLPPPPSSSSVQCSAYFISRVDLNNYTIQTLKQTIDNVVAGQKSKGLKVKLSLPDEGLIIENKHDPNQSWMYRTSELLYFWRDSYFSNIIIVITINRINYQPIGPYSASIFRLRGNESIPLFIQRSQEFFAQLSSKTNYKTSIEKSKTDNNNNHKKKSRHHSKSKQKSSPPSQMQKSVPNTEFNPKQITTTDSIFNLYNRRTYSETTISSDTRTSNSKNHLDDDDDDDEKMTTVSNYLPNGYINELVRELKELRNEIAALKLEKRSTPVRSTSTSPMNIPQENSNHTIMNSSQSEIDAETQTDFSLMETEIKNDLSNGILVTNKRKNEQKITKVNKRTLLTDINHRKESIHSSPINGLSNDIYSPYTQQGDYQTTSYPTISNSKPLEKESSSSSSIPMDTESSLSIQKGEVISFRSSLEDTIAPPENIYENLPIFIPINSNQEKQKLSLHVTIPNDQNSKLQQEYLSQLFGTQNGISSLIPQEILQNNINTISATQSHTILNSQYYLPQVFFSDHLTNPLFKIDKQLLINTIANQFGMDLNSQDLPKLITNQHLFVRNKRTFANMIWQIPPEEEYALCSSPITTSSSSNNIDIQTINLNNSTIKSILKSKKSSRLTSKGQHISWDTTLE